MPKSILSRVWADLKEGALIFGKFEGAGASNPDYPIANPPGWTVTRQGTGNYRVTFTDDYSALIAMNAGLSASTPADLAGHTLVWDDYVPRSGNTAAYRDVTLYNAADTAHDLAANEFIEFVAVFQNTSVRQ
jgi:hypothetical protein